MGGTQIILSRSKHFVIFFFFNVVICVIIHLQIFCQILHDAGLRVEELIDDDLTMSTNDSLQRSVGTLEIYRALASPAYVCFDPDPIGRAFHMSSLLRKLALLEVEFKLTYLELANGMEQYAADIISYTVTTEEVRTSPCFQALVLTV